VADPYLTADDARSLGVEHCSVEEVFTCPVVSLHAPSLPQTRHLANAQRLALLPDHAVFLNTARGSLVDEQALIAEVRRRPLYVLLDVTDPPPPVADSPLRTSATLPPGDSPLRTEPNILLTPHVAGAMQQARRTMGRLAIAEVLRFLRGAPLEHEVTRDSLAIQA
jgi:phosphoglycerate dehydrogenase-like enzyme